MHPAVAPPPPPDDRRLHIVVGATRRRARRAPRLLTVEHAAEQLDTSESTVRRLLKQGELRTVRWDRYVRVRDDDLAQFIDRHSEGAS